MDDVDDGEDHEQLQSSGRPKKRARTINNLTEEQLQHKRNVDRKAQRAFRQRTKDSIVKLEQHIAHLEKAASDRQDRYQQQLSALKGTNTSLLQCLKQISELASATAQSIAESKQADRSSETVERHDLQHATIHLTHEQSSALANSLHHAPPGSPADTPNSNSRLASSDHESPGCTVPLANHAATGVSEEIHSPQSSAAMRREQQEASEQTPEQVQVGSVYHHPHDFRLPGTAMAGNLRTSHSSPPASIEYGHVGSNADHFSPSSFALTHVASHEYRPDSVLSPAMGSAYSTHSMSDYGSVSTALPSHLPPTCPLDEILHAFLRARREMIAQGVPIETVIGSPKPSVKGFMNPEMTDTAHPICGVMSEVLSTFPHVPQPEKFAFLYLMHKTMRWQILPAKESYTAMPTWLRPTVTQITVRHAAWIDNIPWPGVRDILIENAEEHPFEDFSQYYSQNVSVNWNFDSLDAISDIGDEVYLHSIFEKHVCNLKNWTVSKVFRDRYPAMVNAIYARD